MIKIYYQNYIYNNKLRLIIMIVNDIDTFKKFKHPTYPLLVSLLTFQFKT